MAKICIKCGKIFRENFVFCPFCGVSLQKIYGYNSYFTPRKAGEAVEHAPSDEQTVQAYRQAAQRGDAGAQFKLAECYAEGDGVQKSLQTAKYWYKKAAEQGNEGAQVMLDVLEDAE